MSLKPPNPPTDSAESLSAAALDERLDDIESAILVAPAPTGVAATDTAAIQALITAATTRVQLRAGDYAINKLTGADGVDLVGIEGKTRLLQSSNDFIYEAQGTVPAADLTTLSANAAWGAESVTVTSATGLAVGDWVLIGADTAFSTERPNEYKGEFQQIETIASTTVTFTRPLRDAYTTAASAGLRKVTFIRGNLRDLTLVNPSPGTRTAGLAYFGAVRDLNINVRMEGSDGPGLTLDNCLDFEVDAQAFNFTDDSANGRYGYGVLVTRASEGGEVKIKGRRTRHAFTTDGTTNKRGVVRHVNVSGVSIDGSNSAFDTHATCEDINFEDCLAQGSRMWAFYNRGKDCTVRASKATDCAAGVGFSADARGGEASGNTLKRIGRITPADTITKDAFHVAAPYTVIKDNVAEGVAEYGVRVDSVVGARVTGNLLRNVAISNPSGGLYGIRVTGASVDPLLIEDNHVEHDANDTRPGMLDSTVATAAIHFDSASAKGIVRNNTSQGITSVIDSGTSQGIVRDGNKAIDASITVANQYGLINLALEAVSGATRGEYATSGIRYWELADAAAGILQAQFQWPQDSMFGSLATVRVHWTSPTTSGNCRWSVTQHAVINGDVAAVAGTAAASTAAAPGTAHLAKTTDLQNLAFTAAASRLVVLRLSRLGADAADTLADVVRVLSVDVLYVKS